MRRKRHLDERLDKCRDYIVNEPEFCSGRWREMYPGFGAVHIELGCGRGRFTVETAKQSPDALVIALEKSSSAMITAVERAMAAELKNVLFIAGLAENLSRIFSAREPDRLYINFCDPWPSRKHEKRRLTSERFLPVYKELLRPGGEIHFKTDNNELFEYSLKSFASHGFALSDVTRDLHANGVVGVMTDYEQKFHERGVSINRCVARIT